MKRALQAGSILFFLLAGFWFINRPDPASYSYPTITLNPDAAFAEYETPDATALSNTDDIDAPPTLAVSSALMKDAAGDRIFYEMNADQRWPLASLTKLMNAVIALEHLPSSEERDNLIRRMMIISDNSAADALAEQLGMTQYINLMNAKAESLNMRQTGFSDASGLSYLNQSTVRDIDKLVTYIMVRHPEIFAWSREKTTRIGAIERANINEFVNRPDFLGGKTGFTDEANGNLVTVFQTVSGPVAIITLGSPTREDRFRETDILFSWATRHFKL